MSQFSVRILFVLFSVVGFALLPLLSVRWSPSQRTTTLTVSFSWNDVSPAVVEQRATAPLESVLATVEGIEGIHSISQTGGAVITLEADKHLQLDFLRFRLAARIKQVYPTLPAGVSYPSIQFQRLDNDRSRQPLLNYAISSDDPTFSQYDYLQSTLPAALNLLPGVERTELTGFDPPELRIRYHPERCRVLGIEKADLLTALQRAFGSDALGLVRARGQVLTVKRNGHLNGSTPPRPSDIAQIPVRATDGKHFPLGQLADVSTATLPPTGFYRIDGRSSVRLLVYARDNANALRTSQRVRETLTELANRLPPGYRMTLEYDASERLSEELRKTLQRVLASLGILLVFVGVVYRRRSLVVPIVLGLLANLGITFMLYYAFRIELNSFSMAGIAVSFGIVIDNSIVMTDHWVRRGNRRVFPAIATGTATTLASLVLLFSLPEVLKNNLTDFSLVIVLSLLVSLVVSGLFIPAVVEPRSTAFRSDDRPSARYQNFVRGLLRWRVGVWSGAVLLFGIPLFLLPVSLPDHPTYNEWLGYQSRFHKVRPLLETWLGGTLTQFVRTAGRRPVYRPAAETTLFVEGSMPSGSTVEQMNAVFRRLEAYLEPHRDKIAKYVTNVASGQFGNLRITFHDGYERTFAPQLKKRIVSFCANLGGADWEVYGIGTGFDNAGMGSTSKYALRLIGYDQKQLRIYADTLAGRILRNPRAHSVDTEANLDYWREDLYELTLTPRPAALARYELSPSVLQEILEPFDRTVRPDLFTPQNIAVRMLPRDAESRNRWRLQNEQLMLDSIRFRLSEVADVVETKVAGAVHKQDRQYVKLVEWRYNGSERFGFRHLERTRDELQQALPMGYRVVSNNYDYQPPEPGDYVRFVGLVMLLIFGICAVHFESFRHALTVVMTIPLSFIGIFGTLSWLDLGLNPGSIAAFVLVSGLSVNGTILVLDELNRRIRNVPHDSFAAHYTAALGAKLVPILLTAVSTALGLLPFLIFGTQADFWYALAAGTIGGLAFSIILLLTVLPTLCAFSQNITHDAAPTLD